MDENTREFTSHDLLDSPSSLNRDQNIGQSGASNAEDFNDLLDTAKDATIDLDSEQIKTGDSAKLNESVDLQSHETTDLNINLVSDPNNDSKYIRQSINNNNNNDNNNNNNNDNNNNNNNNKVPSSILNNVDKYLENELAAITQPLIHITPKKEIKSKKEVRSYAGLSVILCFLFAILSASIISSLVNNSSVNLRNAQFNSVDDVIHNMKVMENNFIGQSSEIWDSLIEQFSLHIKERLFPLCVTFIANEDNSHVQDCFIRKLAKSLTNDHSIYILDVSKILRPPSDHNLIAAELNTTLHATVPSVIYLKEINTISYPFFALFSTLSSPEFTLYKQSVFLFSLVQNNTIRVHDKNHNDLIKENILLSWSEEKGFNQEEVSSVIFRISKLQYVILPESDSFNCN